MVTRINIKISANTHRTRRVILEARRRVKINKATRRNGPAICNIAPGGTDRQIIRDDNHTVRVIAKVAISLNRQIRPGRDNARPPVDHRRPTTRKVDAP